MAIEALSDSETNFVARSSPEDIRQWEVGYYSTFSEQIAKISAGIMSKDYSYIGPYMDLGGIMKFPNYAGALDEAHVPVDPFATFTIQLYWQVMGQARFFDNFDQSFRDESRVFLLGTGVQPDLPEERLIRVRDPRSGLTYGAIRYPGEVGAGEALLERALQMLRWSTMCDGDESTAVVDDDCDPQFPQGQRRRVDPELLDHFELIKVMADLAPMMEFGSPYAP